MEGENENPGDNGVVLDNDTGMELEVLSDALRFDPFDVLTDKGEPVAQGDSDPAAPTAGQPGGEPKTEGEPQGGEGDQQPPAEPATQPQSVSPEMAALQAQLAALQGELQGLRSAQPKPDTKPNDQPQGPKVPDYPFTISDNLAALMNSEDPKERLQGAAILATGVAQRVHETIMGEVNTMFQKQLPTLVHGMQTYRAKQEEVMRDFYGTFKELDNEAIKPLVVQVAGELWKTGKHKAWTKEFRDELGTTVKTLLANATGKPAVQQQPKPQPKPPVIQSPGTRPGAGPGQPPRNSNPNDSAAIADLLDIGSR